MCENNLQNNEKNFNDVADKRVAVIGIIVSRANAVDSVNAVLHEYGLHIVGRMGLPLRDRNVNAISVVLDAPSTVINALSGKLGRIDGVTAKALFQKI